MTVLSMFAKIGITIRKYKDFLIFTVYKLNTESIIFGGVGYEDTKADVYIA